MTKLNCYLECGHEIEWGESPEAPGAALPRVAQIVYCPECEEDQEIEEIKPSQVIVETLECATRKLHVFYDAYTGTWGWCIAVEKNGIYAETEDITGFESPEAVKEAGLTCYKKGGPNMRPNT